MLVLRPLPYLARISMLPALILPVIRTILLLMPAVFCTALALPAKGQDVATVHQALTPFNTATNGDHWTHNTHWDINTVSSSMGEFGQWYGLTVHNDTLRRIGLVENNLHGSLPPELGNLRELKVLDSANNQLTGPLPSELGNLLELEDLFLGRNQFIGSLPPELGSLQAMETLNLGQNQFTGSLPPGLRYLPKLAGRSLYSNQFTGSTTSGIYNWITTRRGQTAASII